MIIQMAKRTVYYHDVPRRSIWYDQFTDKVRSEPIGRKVMRSFEIFKKISLGSSDEVNCPEIRDPLAGSQS